MSAPCKSPATYHTQLHRGYRPVSQSYSARAEMPHVLHSLVCCLRNVICHHLTLRPSVFFCTKRPCISATWCLNSPPPHTQTSQDHQAPPLQLSCFVSRPAPEDMQSGFTVGAEMPHVQPKPVCFFQEFDLPLHDALSFNVFLCQREPGFQGPSTRRDQERGECVFRRSSWMLLI